MQQRKERRLTVYEKILVPLDGSKRAETIRPMYESWQADFMQPSSFITVIEHIYADGIGQTYISISEKAFNAQLKDNELYLK